MDSMHGIGYNNNVKKQKQNLQEAKGNSKIFTKRTYYRLYVVNLLELLSFEISCVILYNNRYNFDANVSSYYTLINVQSYSFRWLNCNLLILCPVTTHTKNVHSFLPFNQSSMMT